MQWLLHRLFTFWRTITPLIAVLKTGGDRIIGLWNVHILDKFNI